MRSLAQDLRYAVRLLRRSPGFTVVAALTLMLGIGATTAIFSVVHGVLLKPLPYPEPDQLIRVFEESPSQPEFSASIATLLAWREQSRAFESIAAFQRADLQLGGDRPEQLRGMRVTARFFHTLGYAPSFGRDFTQDDEAIGHETVAILSHPIWVRRFNADPSIVGRTVILSGRSFEIVGVLPPGVQHVGGHYRSYQHGESVDVWWPQTLPSTLRRMDRVQHYLSVVARMRPGVTVAQAQDDVRRVSARLEAEHPDTNSRWSSHVRPLRADIIGTSEPTLFALLAATGAVLLIACLNVAALLLGRATARGREIGVRFALGATRTRLVSQLIVESALLAAGGGALGVGLAYAAVHALVAFAPPDIPRLQMVSVDSGVLTFMIAMTAITALLCGAAPALQLARSGGASGLSSGSPGLSGGRGAPGGAQQRLRRALVAAEIALAFALVTTGALLMRSFASLLRLDPGFRPSHVLTAVVNLPPARYKDTADAAAFFTRLVDRVRALPGVGGAGLSSDLPWTGYDENTGFGIVGRQFPPHEGPEARYHFLTPGFIEAVGLPLRAGRDVRPSDVPKAPLVVLVNESTARRYWKDPQAAIGAQLDLWGETRTIVGVIGDVKDTPWAESSPGGVYFPQAQIWYPQDMILTVRTAGDAMALAEPLTRGVRDLDPELPLANVRTLDQVAGSALATRRFTLVLVASFGIASLFLALVGVYGVMAQGVGQRIREFGVRQALGARPADIFRLVVSGGFGIAIAGIVAGIAIVLPVTRLIRSLLFRTSPSDPATLSGVAAALLIAALAASFIPARRATRVDPASALRQE
ncbi:MAG TPA: ABC transporter permease [Vicinamibacterales bacterium]